MAPKRRSSSRLVVKTTKQVLKETVEVSVVPNKKRQRKVKDNGHDPVKSTTIAMETKEENQTEKVEVSVGKEPAKIIVIGSQQGQHADHEEGEEPEETTTIPVEDASMKSPDIQGGASPLVDEERSKETSTIRDEEEPEEENERQTLEEERERATTISMDNQEGSETQNYEDDKEPKETPMTPGKKEKNRPSKGEEEKRIDGKQKTGGGQQKDKKRKRRTPEGGEGYKRYVYKVLKQVHPELGMSAKAMVVLNNYMNDMFERVANEAAKLTMYTSRKTLSSREVQAAVKLVLPGELGKHAMAEGTKAVSNYFSRVQQGPTRLD